MKMQQKDKEILRASGTSGSSLPDSLCQLIRGPGMRRIRSIYHQPRVELPFGGQEFEEV